MKSSKISDFNRIMSLPSLPEANTGSKTTAEQLFGFFKFNFSDSISIDCVDDFLLNLRDQCIRRFVPYEAQRIGHELIEIARTLEITDFEMQTQKKIIELYIKRRRNSQWLKSIGLENTEHQALKLLSSKQIEKQALEDYLLAVTEKFGSHSSRADVKTFLCEFLSNRFVTTIPRSQCLQGIELFVRQFSLQEIVFNRLQSRKSLQRSDFNVRFNYLFHILRSKSEKAGYTVDPGTFSEDLTDLFASNSMIFEKIMLDTSYEGEDMLWDQLCKWKEEEEWLGSLPYLKRIIARNL